MKIFLFVVWVSVMLGVLIYRLWNCEYDVTDDWLKSILIEITFGFIGVVGFLIF